MPEIGQRREKKTKNEILIMALEEDREWGCGVVRIGVGVCQWRWQFHFFGERDVGGGGRGCALLLAVV